MNNQAQIEWLDSSDASGEELIRVIQELDRINRWLGNEQAMCSRFEQFLRYEFPTQKKDITLVDIGCGSGYILSCLSKVARRLEKRIKLIGIDQNSELLDLASRKLENETFQAVEADLTGKDFELPQCDVLVSSHFIYHLSEPIIERLLIQQSQRVEHLILFSELRPNSFSASLFPRFGQLMGLHHHTIEDGVKAIQRAHSVGFYQDLVKQTGNEAIVSFHWFNRVLFTWVKS